MSTKPPTPDPPLNAVLYELVASVKAILGENFAAAYLQGSFAIGDWDLDSDVDFIVTMDHEVSAVELSAIGIRPDRASPSLCGKAGGIHSQLSLKLLIGLLLRPTAFNRTSQP